MMEQTSNWGCMRCEKVMSDYADVGYDGPADPTGVACYPFMDWLVLCQDCFEADAELKEAVDG